MKLKYKFRVYNLLESYPTEEDALFEITNFLRERNRLEEEWSDLGIKGAFSKKLTEEETSKLLQSLVDQGFLTMKAGSGKRNYFRIITSPFI
jgi:hypothetical protein